jgi:hypothetical protein
MQSNGTTARFLDRINPANGGVLAIANGAKGPGEWALRAGSTETAFGLGIDYALTWADATTVAALTALPSSPGTLELSTTPGPSSPLHPVLRFEGPSVPSQGEAVPVALEGTHDGLVLVQTGGVLGSSPGGPQGQLLIDPHTGTAVEVPMRDAADQPLLVFAGWIDATGTPSP